MGREPYKRRVYWLAAVAMAAACGGGDGDAPASDGGSGVDAAAGAIDAGPAPAPDAGPITASSLCQELTTMLCAAEQACCTDASARHASAEACFAATNADCLADLQAPASDGRTGYDPAIARAELDELAARLATCDSSIGPWFVSHQGLLRIYQGTVASGGDCSPSSASDTVPVLSCVAPAVCRLRPLPLGGTCGAARTQGDSCVTEIECADGLRCNPPESLNGQCAPRLATGMGCTIDGDCTSLICEGNQCVDATVDRVYCFDR